jgi:flagellar motor switch/type III secretory pathway protein FliN
MLNLSNPESASGFVEMVRAALSAEVRAHPELSVSLDPSHPASFADVSKWVSYRSEQGAGDAVFLGASDATVTALSEAPGADSHADPIQHAARTVSNMLQASLKRVARRLREILDVPLLGVDNGSGNPDPSLNCLASYSLTCQGKPAGVIILVANSDVVRSWENQMPFGQETAQKVEPASASPIAGNLLLSVEIPVTLSLGTTHVTLGEAMGFGGGSIVKLGCPGDAPVDIIVGGKTIARGSVVSVDGMYGVKVSEVYLNRPAVA